MGRINVTVLIFVGHLPLHILWQIGSAAAVSRVSYAVDVIAACGTYGLAAEI